MKTKSIWKIALVILVLAILAVGGGYAGYRAYLSARQSHLIKQAQHYLVKSDVKKATLCLQRVLRSNPKNVDACRLMAELSEAGRSPVALVWRSRVVELNPASLDDRLALAQSALIFHEHGLATNALAGVDATGKKTAVYHNIAGEVASTVGDLAQAEADFSEAARLDPTNPVPQLNLAVVRLHGTNAPEMAKARAALTQITSTSSALRCQALRELVVDSLRFRQTNAAVQLSADLVQQTNSTFSDQLLRLDVLKVNKSGDFDHNLAAIRHEACTNLAEIYELSQWQMPRMGPAETLSWLQSLAMVYQTNQPAAMLTAQCQGALSDWRGLQNSLKQENWAELEFLRHALLARALRGQDLTEAAKGEWELALKTANSSTPNIQKNNLTKLLQLAAAWNWQNESEDLLWIIVNQYPDDKWAFSTLNQTLYANGRTRPMMMLFSQELRRSPSNLAIKNNLAMTALLLDAQELNPNELAREVYQQAPTNAAYISTYAFSLHLQKKDAEALKVIEQLKPQELQDPSIAGYYSLILQATGNKEKARSYLNLAFKGPMLPEEKKMFERAKTGA
jgi:Tfp pilus assembly protein PilF